jgi:hypothetical protein
MPSLGSRTVKSLMRAANDAAPGAQSAQGTHYTAQTLTQPNGKDLKARLAHSARASEPLEPRWKKETAEGFKQRPGEKEELKSLFWRLRLKGDEEGLRKFAKKYLALNDSGVEEAIDTWLYEW